LFRKGYPKNVIRKEEKRKNNDNLVRQHPSVDRYGLKKNTESNGQQKSMEIEGRSTVAVNPRIKDD